MKPLPSKIPFLDVGAAYIELKTNMNDAIQRVLDSHTYILGKEVQSFEDEFANYVSAGHCVGVANGLEALRLALRAVGVEQGDEVIAFLNSSNFSSIRSSVTFGQRQFSPKPFNHIPLSDIKNVEK